MFVLLTRQLSHNYLNKYISQSVDKVDKMCISKNRPKAVFCFYTLSVGVVILKRITGRKRQQFSSQYLQP